MDYLDTQIENLPNTKTLTISRLKSLSIKTYRDLINYFPFRYDDYSLVSAIEKIQDGEILTVKGKLIEFKNIFTRSGLKIQKGILTDGVNKIWLIWYNQSYLTRVLKPGVNLSLAGQAKGFFPKITLEVKDYEIIKDPNQQTIHTGRLVPIYPEKKGLSSRTIREKIYHVITQASQPDENNHHYGIKEILPAEIIAYNNLLDESQAYQNIHFPKDISLANKARQRLAFDELFVIGLSASLIRKQWRNEQTTSQFTLSPQIKSQLRQFIDQLPFKLTNAQKRAIGEIINDLIKKQPMNRFLEGDVGSGKTVVAAIASYFTYLNGFRTLFMAPTEILANQHYQTIQRLFTPQKSAKPRALSGINYPKILLITGTRKPREKDLQQADIIIGTQALIFEKLKFKKVALAIIDEQHRFGVVQRAKLKEKGINPHLLTMTATPIPRTVALTLYGELDLSIIDEMPAGRLPIKTFLVPKEKRSAGYQWIRNQIKQNGVQVFIICPLISESEIETMQTVKAATKEFEYLKKEVFPDLKLGLLHGRIKAKLKDAIMADFKNKKFDILVATPVVEVGIDIPNATIMVIEGAERFGLAQLHQLRGRVGRSNKQSYCLLYTQSEDEKVVKRLKLFANTQSGIKVAEYDLKLRGPGEVYGTRQHGFLNLKIATLTDYPLIKKSKQAVNYFFSKYSLEKFPELKKRLQEYQTKQISRD